MKKIMFSNKYGLTQAVLEGRKTMTRRIAYDKPLIYGCHIGLDEKGHLILLNGWERVAVSKYAIGEEVAVAQCYEEARKAFAEDQQFYLGYSIDVENAHQKLWEDIQGVHNSMFVKAAIMPHRIRITDIKVERLQDISDEDILREGISEYTDEKGTWYQVENSHIVHYNLRQTFSELIDKVSGRGTWERNP